MTTGADLRRERRERDITVVDLARQLGTSRQRVHELERRPTVTDERASEFRQAMATLTGQGDSA